MTPETAFYFAKARELLLQAEAIKALGFSDAAGRSAYLAAFHAAQALISERTGRAVKTHRGVRSEFHRLTRGETRFDESLKEFLGSAYELKTAADYLTGPSA